MNVAIYGDSFGYEELLFNEYHPNIEHIGKSWVTYLRSNYNITNFSKPASDLYYSYNLFLQNYKKYDKNIFLITAPGRLSIKFSNEYIHSHNVLSAIGKHKIEKNTEKRKVLTAAIDYFNYIQDDNKDIEVNRLLINELSKLDHKLLKIYCFGADGLYNITKLEDSTWNLKQTYTSLDNTLDLRYSHMTKENNYALYSIVKHSLENNTNFEFDIKNFNAPKKDEKNLYIVDKLL